MFNHPAIRKCKESVRRAGNFQARPKLFITRVMVEEIMNHCRDAPHLVPYSMLFLTTYCFLLRLPSEALPIKLCEDSLCIQDDTLVLRLPRRKNKPSGSRLVRTCWCAESKVF